MTQEQGYEARGPFPVYIARMGSRASKEIDRGAGIVGHPDDVHVAPDGSVQVFFEGNRFGGEALRLWANRVALAADRCRWRRDEQGEWVAYPTPNKLWANPAELVLVGTFDDQQGDLRLAPAADLLLLRSWLDHPRDFAAELRATGVRYARRGEAAER